MNHWVWFIPAIIITGSFLRYLLRQEFRSDRVPVLLYHRLRPKESAVELDWERIFVVYAEEFDRQMEFLREHGYQVISLDDYLSFVNGKKKLPAKPVILTFDDGYQSIYKYAWPVLKRLDFPATVFVTADENAEVFHRFHPFDGPLRRDQVKEMSDGGISIQSHGITHRPLSEMTDEEVRKELAGSRSILEEITARPVKFLAIPGAFYSASVKRLTREAGYEAAFSGHKGSNNRHSELFSLRRIVPERDFTISDFAASLLPWAACQWRVVGFLKSIPTVFLGPTRGKKLRVLIYRSKFGFLLSYKNFSRIMLWFLAAVMLVAAALFLRAVR